MPPLEYITLRLIRRVLPPKIVQQLLRLRIAIEPGLETREPESAADRYQIALASMGANFDEKRILILGYGGSFGLAHTLLQRGAGHIVLLDPFAEMKQRENRRLARTAPEFFSLEDDGVAADPSFLTIVHKHLSNYLEMEPSRVDLVLSSSVYEHLPDPREETKLLRRLTKPDGHHVHVIDLRDHYFQRPFEMLTYAGSTWRRFLNPPSHLNRMRMGEYEAIFRHGFEQVRVDILEADEYAFGKAKSRIRPEFLSGDDERDSATKILILASKPIYDSG